MKLHHKVFLLLLFLLPTQLAIHFWPDWSLVQGIRVDYLAPTVYLTDIIIVFLFFVWIVSEDFKFRIKMEYVYLPSGIIILSAINILLSYIWQISLYKWIKVGELIFLTLYVKENWKLLKNKVWIPLSLSLVYVFVVALGQIVLQRTIGGVFYWLGERNFTASTPGIALANIFGVSIMRPYSVFSHPNSMAGFVLVTSIILYVLSKKQNQRNRSLLFFVMALGIFLVLLSFSQLAWIALFITLIFLVFKKTRGLLKIFLTALFLVSLLLPLLSQGLLGSFDFPQSIEKRLELSVVSGHLISQRPVFGVGLGNSIAFPESLLDNKIVQINKTVWFFQPVHNIFLLILIEMGLLGIIVFYFALMTFFRMAKNSEYFFSLLPVLIIGLGDHYWLTLQQNSLLAAIIVGIMTSEISETESPN